VGFPIRRFTDQSLFAAPRDLSQRTTSFIASQRQGIHQTPLRHLIALIARTRFRSEDRRQRTETESAHALLTLSIRRPIFPLALARKDQFCFKRIRGSWRSATWTHDWLLAGEQKTRKLKNGLIRPRFLSRPSSGNRMRFLFTMSEIRRRRTEDGEQSSPCGRSAVLTPSASLISARQTHESHRKEEAPRTGLRPLSSVLRHPIGGARRDRTDDLMLAKHALSQLSYGPVSRPAAPKGRSWWAWEDLNLRPHAYQARALTN
jgi:hypothetical protein